MKPKKLFNELYVLFINYFLLFAVPILWIIYMDEASSFTRVVIPIILFGFSLYFTTQVSKFVLEEKEDE